MWIVESSDSEGSQRFGLSAGYFRLALELQRGDSRDPFLNTEDYTEYDVSTTDRSQQYPIFWPGIVL